MNQDDNKDKDANHCQLCGRKVATSDELELLSRTGEFLCLDCLDEEMSCGCEDD